MDPVNHRNDYQCRKCDKPAGCAQADETKATYGTCNTDATKLEDKYYYRCKACNSQAGTAVAGYWGQCK